MKSLLKLTLAITAAATLGTAGLIAGAPFRSPYENANIPPRVLAPSTGMKCETMSIRAPLHQGGWMTVSCQDYAGIRPDDCRRACASK